MSASKFHRMVKTALAFFACVFLCSFFLQGSPARAQNPADYHPNIDQEFTPQGDDSDIPKTKAPVAGYNEFPISRYHLDIYKPKEDGSKGKEHSGTLGFATKTVMFITHPKLMTKQAAKSTTSSILASVEMFFVNLIWRGYRMMTHAGIAVLTQAFTFDLVHHFLGAVGNVIHELGTGIKFLMSFMLFLAASFLIFRLAQGQFRNVLGSLLIAALFAAGFSWYLAHATDVMRALNSGSNQITNAVLNSASYAINESEATKAADGNQAGPQKEDTNKYLGVSKMRNVMHDLFIVKPYELMQYGTTDLAVIGGANPDHANAQNQKHEEAKAQKQDGRQNIRDILKQKPNTKKRNKAVKEQTTKTSHTIMPPFFISQRVSISLMIWLPLLFVMPILVVMAVMEQVYSLMFLAFAVVGVFTIFMAIFPPWQSFVRGWIKNVLKMLAMKIGLAMMLVLMFTFTNIAYRISNSTLALGYGGTMLLIIIIFCTIFAFRKQMFGRDTYERQKGKVQRGTQVAGALALGAATGGAGAGAASAATKSGAATQGSGVAARRMTSGKLGHAGRMMGGKAGQRAQAAQGVINWRRQRQEEKAPQKEQKAEAKAQRKQARRDQKAEKKNEKNEEGVLHQQPHAPGSSRPANQEASKKHQDDAVHGQDQSTSSKTRSKRAHTGHGVINAQPNAETAATKEDDDKKRGYQPSGTDDQGFSRERQNKDNPPRRSAKERGSTKNTRDQGVLHKQPINPRRDGNQGKGDERR